MPIARLRREVAWLGLALACGLALLALPTRASARREASFNYAYTRVWTSAVRLMRLDFECSITEKDKDDGYFLFEYPDRGKTYSGSVEFVPTKQGDIESVRVVIQIAALPSYVEAMMMDRLARKLDQEFGPPKESKPRDDGTPPKEDAPADSDKGKPAPAKPKQDGEQP